MKIEWCQIKPFIDLLSQAVIAGSSAILAYGALKGLAAWKTKTNTEIKTKFIDELIDIMSQYMEAISAPVQLINFSIEIGIRSYDHTTDMPDSRGQNEDFIQYIENRGQEDSKEIFNRLEIARPIKNKMNGLVIKGQVFGFENYHECLNAWKMLEWSFKQIEGTALFIGMRNLNWENPEIQKALSTHRKISSSEIKENLEKHNSAILIFAEKNFKNLLS